MDISGAQLSFQVLSRGALTVLSASVMIVMSFKDREKWFKHVIKEIPLEDLIHMHSYSFIAFLGPNNLEVVGLVRPMTNTKHQF